MPSTSLPATTRLRFVSAKDAESIVDFLDALGVRVQIYGSPVWQPDEERWFLWFVPDDRSQDIVSTHL